MKVYNAKLGTQPASVQMRHRYGLYKGDVIEYRRVTINDKGKWVPIESWKEGVVDKSEVFPHLKSAFIFLSKR